MLGTDPISANFTPPLTGATPAGSQPPLVSGLLSVVIRAHKACDKRLLQQSLHSIASQSYHPVEVIVATDSADLENQTDIAKVIADETWQGDSFARVEVVDCSDLADSRSRLMNQGIKRSTGQYLAFLDYDDIVYEDSYFTLINELAKSGKGVAAGGTRVAEVSWKDGILEVQNYKEFPHDGRSKVDLWKGNFLPIHSVVINRSVVPSEAIYTDESMLRLEDHCLLLRISFVSEFSLAKLGQDVCEYRVFDGVFSGDRSKFSDAKDSDIAAWCQSKEHIQSIIAEATASVDPVQLRVDIEDRVALECSRTAQKIRAEMQVEIEALKQRLNESEQTNVSLSYQIEKWKSSNESLGAMLDQQGAELSRKPYKLVRSLVSWLRPQTK